MIEISNLNDDVFTLIKKHVSGISTIGCFTKKPRNTKTLSFNDWFYAENIEFKISIIDFEDKEHLNELLKEEIYFQY